MWHSAILLRYTGLLGFCLLTGLTQGCGHILSAHLETSPTNPTQRKQQYLFLFLKRNSFFSLTQVTIIFRFTAVQGFHLVILEPAKKKLNFILVSIHQGFIGCYSLRSRGWILSWWPSISYVFFLLSELIVITFKRRFPPTYSFY